MARYGRMAVLAVIVDLLLVSAVSSYAQASCVEEIDRARTQGKLHANQGDREKFRKELAQAQDLAATDEMGCLNAVARARKALNAEPPNAKAAYPVVPTQPLHQR
jgi:hypothetical protein